MKRINSPSKFQEKRLCSHFSFRVFYEYAQPGCISFWFAWTTLIMADSQTAAHPGEYRFIVFTTCLVFVLLSDILKVVLAGKLRSRLTAKNLHFINKLSGLILIGFGVALCWGVLALL